MLLQATRYQELTRLQRHALDKSSANLLPENVLFGYANRQGFWSTGFAFHHRFYANLHHLYPPSPH